jgi:hypothetical protein
MLQRLSAFIHVDVFEEVGRLRSDLRVTALLKALIDNTLQASKSVAKEEVLFILGVE